MTAHPTIDQQSHLPRRKPKPASNLRDLPPVLIRLDLVELRHVPARKHFQGIVIGPIRRSDRTLPGEIEVEPREKLEGQGVDEGVALDEEVE